MDNQRLPFPSDFFDAYMSNLSLMLVQYPEKQIRECYRVLQKGSKACYTVWGRPEECIQFTILREALGNLGQTQPPLNSAFAVGADKEGTKQKFLDAGFNEVKMWYQASNWLYRDGKELIENFMPTVAGQYAKNPEVMTEVCRLYDTKYRESNNTFEVLIILAYKD